VNFMCCWLVFVVMRCMCSVVLSCMLFFMGVSIGGLVN